MGLNSGSRHYTAYYDHVLGRQELSGTIAIMYDLISDISDRRGLKREWNQIDGDIQDEIIDEWLAIIEGTNAHNNKSSLTDFT